MKLSLPPSPRNSIITLMWRDKIPWQCKLEPEQKLCIEIADTLRRHTLDGRLKGVWCHIPNEGKRHAFVGIILRAMGLIKGATDYFFAWRGGCGVIEVKTDSGRLSENQIHFEAWCQQQGIPYALCRSIEEVEAALRLWGALT